jgi:hypothetical protein
MRSKEYIAAVDEAFKPWLLDWPPGYVECAFKFAGCKRTFPRNEIAACHIFGKKAHPKLRNKPLNILPGCYFCHKKFDNESLRKKHAIVESIVPGRISALERLIKEKAFV